MPTILQKLGLACFLMVVCGACYEDLGSYDYHDVNAVTISDLDSAYSVVMFNELSIDPTLTFTEADADDLSRYTFEWFVVDLTNTTLGERNTLSTEKTLAVSINLAPATYDAYFVVVDTETDVEFVTSFSLTVETEIAQGWMVLTDVSGEARLDMVSYFDGAYGVINDVLGYASSSLTLSGEPVNVTCVPRGTDFYGIYISTTGNGTTRIHPETFDWETTYQVSYEMVDLSLPEDFLAETFTPVYTTSKLTTTNTCFAYNDGNIYWGSSYFYAVPLNIAEDEASTFHASKYLARIYSDGYVFDEDNRRILHQQSNAYSLDELEEGDYFDFNDIGMDLVFMAPNWYNDGVIFAIFKDPSSGDYYSAVWGYDAANQTHYGVMDATDIDQATHFGMSAEYGYIFYSVGGKLYEYDFSLNTSYLMLDVGSNQISYMSCGSYFALGSKTSHVDDQNKVIVGIYDPTGTAGSNGTLEVYSVQPVHGALELEQHYEGLGKIVDVSYRQR